MNRNRPSTAVPFATAVAEEFGRTTSFKTPIAEDVILISEARNVKHADKLGS